MVLEFLKKRGSKQAAPTAEAATAKSPVLSEQDEKFLEKILSQEQSPPDQALVLAEPPQGRNAQTALLDGADTVPLPTSPPAVEEDKKLGEGKKPAAKRNYWAYIQSKVPPLGNLKDQGKHRAGANLTDVANAVKTGDSLAPPAVTVTDAEADDEKKEITGILDRLNLSAVNNRAFSFSKESQKLMDDFTQVLKDLVNGVPTAYDDLEKLLTNSDKQLRGMFDNLPPFLQKLVKSLPTKMTGSIAPGLLAAAADKPGADAQAAGAAGVKPRSRIPSLKKLVAQQGAITTMLRSIFNFLKLRFPVALTGTNVLLSLAVFLLLFVFWYCHKRGRETRLEKERVVGDNDSDASVSASDLEDSIVLDDKPDPDVERAEAILNQPSTSASQLKKD